MLIEPHVRALRSLMGKRISGFVLAESRERDPRSALHILFEDGFSYEIYCLRDVIHFTKHLGTETEDSLRAVLGPDFSVESIAELDP
jgi:hypothetical protein